VAALAGVCIELPAVIGALHRSAVETTERKGKRSVRADVAQRKGFSGAVASQDQRDFEQHRALEVFAPQLIASQRGIPESHSMSPAESRGFEEAS